MIYTKPYFYDDFKCKADKCTDTCCAGWEVDIDEDSYEKYRNVSGEFAKRLTEGIDTSGDVPCFKLCENDRCVFLNKSGLCDIYSQLGEDYLCEICSEHPRFYDFFDGVTEMGLGLCCEKVCEMIFSSEKCVTFVSFSDDNDAYVDEDDELYFSIRERLFGIMYDREMPLRSRILNLIEYAVSVQNEIFADNYVFDSDADVKNLFHSVVEMFSETEPINEEWRGFIKYIYNNIDTILTVKDAVKFKESEYEQILTYILFRHFMKSRFTGNILHAVCFSIVSLIFIFITDCKIFSDNREYTAQDRIDNVKLWSKQIEYSEENTQYIFDKSFDLLINE